MNLLEAIVMRITANEPIDNEFVHSHIASVIAESFNLSRADAVTVQSDDEKITIEIDMVKEIGAR